ncbi:MULTISPECIES: phosphate ABC transporter permease subunit PstC [Gemmobacter]|jgi:phosphate transport system permease protein|uniref:Phosphate transport system permease protein n=2 Tax=Gemmobacter TaxID=204456 RepID=A0A2T6B556_9RHOB|nr:MULTISPECIES: phosphate ABC transporter permease subunit PstC [Gemmobacter]PTX51162.1 phosphate ABC transporter membrane protein 1 (PhoT family) [Gemmobacter caeni]TWJ01162.1 phosphate transport system permease protein [Gemmobacter caeni]GHC17895.1 phosphate transport system permease protein [Gemmobacter nanjingensis]
MSIGLITLIVLGLAVLGFILGRQRALSAVGGDPRTLHSLPGYYGWSVFLFTAVPALLLLVTWAFVQPTALNSHVAGMIPAADVASYGSTQLVMADVRRIADGLDAVARNAGLDETGLAALRADLTDMRGRLAEVGVALGSNVAPSVLEAAKEYRSLSGTLRLGMALAVLLAALAGLGFALWRIDPRQRARNLVEQFTLVLLAGCSLIAVATTFGIVASLVVESVHFFKLYDFRDFFFSLTWSPRFGGGSELGLWPLVWGTLYVSFIALLVSVPVGLMAAIYLSEYAGKKVRAFAKPAIEILAGIPTIVYGLFALITVGPFLRDWFAQPMGLGSSSSSVMTAGLVMGIMLIPFVSSLSDDIINAVPQSMRDGSFGLGATRSETVKQVILPAALPGIVGAILLAASRAIGETMIVVMGAGAAAKLDVNPFEAMTTVTVKIVSQLTGDTEFASPETLVAFALGLTLFCFTLALNVVALVIVRKYREQYE